jgi:hypothetical protein
MALKVRDGYVLLPKDSQTGAVKISNELTKQLLPQWLVKEITKKEGAAATRSFQQEYLKTIAAELAKLSNDPENWQDRGVPVGRIKAKIGKTSIPIRHVLWTAAKVSIPAFFAVSALVTGPAGVGLAAKLVAAVVPSIVELYKAIRTFSPTELDVHTAVAMAMSQNSTKTLRGDGVTLKEIEKSFKDPSLVKPKNLKAVLDDMASKEKQMLIKSVDGGVEAYKINKS